MAEEPTTKKVSRTIAVDPALLAELEEEAWMQKTNVSELICRVMAAYLGETAKRPA